MLTQSLPRQLLILRPRTTIVGVRMNSNAATRGEDTRHLDVARIHQLDQILHDDIDTILMEIAMIAEREQVEFQRLRLHHLHIRNVRDDDAGKIWLSCDRAEASKLWAIELHPIIILRMLIDEGLKHLRSVILLIYGLLVTQKGQGLFF